VSAETSAGTSKGTGRDRIVAFARRGMEHAKAGTADLADDVFRVPISAYIDPARFQVEVDRIFKRLPLMLGVSSELREPGAYRALDVAGVPVLMTRGNDGALRAFVNQCSHRGAIVQKEGVGISRRFTCPYHAWSYDLEGDLVGILDAERFGDVDRSCLGLTPLPVAERAGLIWVVLSPTASIDIDLYLCDYDDALKYLGLENAYVVGRQTIPGPNWKVAYDGYLDLYHLPILHKNTFGAVDNKAVFESWGPHQRVTGPARYFDKLVDVPEAEWPIELMVGGVWTIFPHISIAAFDAGGKMYMISQLFPGETVGESYTTQTFVHTQPPSPEQAQMVAERMSFLHHVVGDEDYYTGKRIQRAAANGAKKEFLFGRNEAGGHRFHQWVEALIATDDDALPGLFHGAGALPNRV
jgi:carnitine monooxygenase subunit